MFKDAHVQVTGLDTPRFAIVALTQHTTTGHCSFSLACFMYVSVESLPNPFSAQETMQGAINRAKAAMQVAVTQHIVADYAIGLEGGLESVGERWFESGWIAVVNKDGRIGLGTSAR